MADNVAITAGTGTNIAADEVTDATLGSCKVQYVKLMDGTLDGTTKAAIGANGLACDVKALPAIPAGTNNIGDVDVLTVPAPLSTTGGGTEATALRVTIATDSTGVVSIDDNGGALTVDGSVTVTQATGSNLHAVLDAGTAAFGKLSANSGVDIGDVDILSIAAGDNNIGNVDIVTVPAPLSTTGAGTVATALRTTLGSDDPAVVSLAALDNSVDGNYLNVNCNIAGTDFVGGAGAVAAGVQRITLASDDPGVTSLALIDNAISGAGFNITQFGGANVPIGAGLEATAVRVTLPTNGTGIVGLAAGTANIGKLTDDQKVDLNKIAGASVAVSNGSAATSLRVTIANDSTGQVVLAAGTAGIGKLTANSGVDIGDVDVTSVVPGVAATSLGKAEDAAHSSGDVGVMALAVRSDSRAALAGTTADYIPLTTDAVGALWVNTTVGYSNFFSIDLDESEEDIKATAGTIHGWYLMNLHTATLYFRFYNATAANTTVGTTAAIMVIPVPAGAAANVEVRGGIAFDTALCAAVTTGIAANDTGAPAANVFVANVFYK
jgi:hypothetical protein